MTEQKEPKHVTIKTEVKFSSHFPFIKSGESDKTKASVVDPSGKMSPEEYEEARKKRLLYDKTKSRPETDKEKSQVEYKIEWRGAVEALKQNRQLTEEQEASHEAHFSRSAAREFLLPSGYDTKGVQDKKQAKQQAVELANYVWGTKGSGRG